MGREGTPSRLFSRLPVLRLKNPERLLGSPARLSDPQPLTRLQAPPEFPEVLAATTPGTEPLQGCLPLLACSSVRPQTPALFLVSPLPCPGSAPAAA